MQDLDVLQDASEVVHYNNPQIPLYIVKSDLLDFPNKCAACHWHDDIEIMYIVEGYISYNVNGEVIDLNTGDAIFVNSRQLHYGFSKDDTNCIYYCYVFHAESLFHNSYLSNTYVKPLVSATSIPYYVFKKTNPGHAKLLTILPEVYHTYQKTASSFELQTISKLLEIWSLWYDSVKPQLDDTHSSTDTNINIQKAMTIFIHKNYQQKLTIKNIASAGHISRTKCCQLFKKYYHTSPIDYLNQYRIEHSTKLLMATDLSITEIALSCGFNCSSYYSECFSRLKGCTPTDYRKKYN